MCVCHSVSGLEASLAHHVVRLCWAAKSDCHFHQRQMIIQLPTQKSKFSLCLSFPTVSLWPHNPVSVKEILYESDASFFLFFFLCFSQELVITHYHIHNFYIHNSMLIFRDIERMQGTVKMIFGEAGGFK